MSQATSPSSAAQESSEVHLFALEPPQADSSASNTIDTLAVELMNVIFELVTDRRGPLHRRALKTALTLSSVSRRWRAIALSLPSLWVSIHGPTAPHLSGSRSNSSFEHHALSRIGAQISRSSPLFFDLAIDFPAVEARATRKYNELILPHLHRCKSLLFLRMTESAIQLMLPHLALDNMETLYLQSEAPVELPVLSQILHSSTRLRTLTLSFRRCTVDQVLGVLREWPGAADLESLNLCDTSHYSFDFQPPDEPMSLPNLRHLGIVNRPISVLISAPNITSLESYGYKGTVHTIHYPKLEHLILNGSKLGPDVDVEDMFPPSLRTITFDESRGLPAGLAILAQSDAIAHTPKLETVEIWLGRVEDPEPLWISLIDQLLEARPALRVGMSPRLLDTFERDSEGRDPKLARTYEVSVPWPR